MNLRYAERHDAMGQALTLAASARRTPLQQERLVELVRALGQRAVYDAARKNQIGPLVADVLERIVGAARLEPEIRETLWANEARVEAILEALGTLGRDWDREGLAWAAIENGGVLLGSQMPVRAFCAGDLDVLVEPGRLGEALAIMHAHGFEPADRRARPTNRMEMVRREGHARSTWINVGEAAFDRMWVPLVYVDRAAHGLSRRVRSPRMDAAWVLQTADALALVAMHTSLHSWVRAPYLRLHVDVDRLACDNQVDWLEVVSEARAMKAPTRVFVSLAMARGLFGTPVSEQALEALAPSLPRWQALRALLERESAIYDGRPKLRPWQTVWLDWLVRERTTLRWAREVLWPPQSWLQTHFGEAPTASSTPWAVPRASADVPGGALQTLGLHYRRYARAWEHWRPV